MSANLTVDLATNAVVVIANAPAVAIGVPGTPGPAARGPGVSVNLSAAYAQASTRVPLTSTPTYEGSGVVVHPSVVFDPQGFGGYCYWMAMTPYPSADGTKENPSILASRDGDTWVVPAGVTNPLVPYPPGGFNSDPSLVIGPDGRMRLLYREYLGAQPAEKMRLISSSDGVTWDAPRTLIATDSTVMRTLAPQLNYDPASGLWVIHALNDAAPRVLNRWTAPALDGPWSGPTPCTITGRAVTPGGPGDPWHMDIHYVSGQWQALASDRGSAGGDLWAATSLNGITWTAGPNIITRGPAPWSAYYKSAFVPAIKDGEYGWDAWLGGASFGASGQMLARSFVTFHDTTASAAAEASVRVSEALAAAKGMPPWLAGDTFARADVTPPGNAESGQAWVTTSGTWKVASKALTITADGNSRIHVETGNADHITRVQVASPLNAQQVWVIGRLVDANNYYRAGINLANPTRVQLQKIVAASATVLIEYAVFDPAAAGQYLELRCIGSTVQVFLNGKALGDALTDTTHAGTKSGLQASSTAVTFRNFTVRTP